MNVPAPSRQMLNHNDPVSELLTARKRLKNKQERLFALERTWTMSREKFRASNFTSREVNIRELV